MLFGCCFKLRMFSCSMPIVFNNLMVWSAPYPCYHGVSRICWMFIGFICNCYDYQLTVKLIWLVFGSKLIQDHKKVKCFSSCGDHIQELKTNGGLKSVCQISRIICGFVLSQLLFTCFFTPNLTSWISHWTHVWVP